MSKKRANKVSLSCVTINEMVRWLTNLKKNEAVNIVSVEIERGGRLMDESGVSPFVEWKPNGTYTITIKVNGGAGEN